MQISMTVDLQMGFLFTRISCFIHAFSLSPLLPYIQYIRSKRWSSGYSSKLTTEQAKTDIISEYAERIFREVGCRGVSPVDALPVGKEGRGGQCFPLNPIPWRINPLNWGREHFFHERENVMGYSMVLNPALTWCL